MALAAVARPLPTVFQSPLSSPSSPLHSNSLTTASSSASHFPQSNPPSGESWFLVSSDSHASSQSSASDHSHSHPYPHSPPLSPSTSHMHHLLPKGARPASPQVNPLVQHCCDVHHPQRSDAGRRGGGGESSANGNGNSGNLNLNLTRSRSLASWKLEWRGVTKVVKWAFPRNSSSSKADTSGGSSGGATTQQSSHISHISGSTGGNGKRSSQSTADADADADRDGTGHRIGKTREEAREHEHAPWRQSSTSASSGCFAPERDESLRGGGGNGTGTGTGTGGTGRGPLDLSASASAGTGTGTSTSTSAAPTSRKLRKPPKFFISPSTSTTFVDRVCEYDAAADPDPYYSDPYSHPHPQAFSSRSELGHGHGQAEELRLRTRPVSAWTAVGSYLETRRRQYEYGTLKRQESLAASSKYGDHAPDHLFSAQHRSVSEIGHGGRELDHVHSELQDFCDSAAFFDASTRCTFSDHGHSDLYRHSSSSMMLLHSHALAPAMSAQSESSYSDSGYGRHGLELQQHRHQLQQRHPSQPHAYHDLPSTSSIAHTHLHPHDGLQQQQQQQQFQPQRRPSLASLVKRKSLSLRSATTLSERRPAHSAPPNPTRSPRKLQKAARSATLPHMYDVHAHTLHHHRPQPAYSLHPPLPSFEPPTIATATATAAAAAAAATGFTPAPTSPRKPFLRSLSSLNLVITPRTPPKTPRKLHKRTSPVSPTAAKGFSTPAPAPPIPASSSSVIPPPPRSTEKVHRTPSRSASLLRSRIASAFVRRSVTPDAESSESSGSSGSGSGSDQQKTPSEECATLDHVSALETLVKSQMAPAPARDDGPGARPSILRTESNRRWTVAAADVPDELFIEELERLRRMGLRAMEVHGSRRTSEEGGLVPVAGGREEAAAMLEANAKGISGLDESAQNQSQSQRATKSHGDLEAEMKEELEWLHARRAILTCRELVRTEKTYQQRLQELADGSVSDAVPSLLLQYLPALIGASKILSQRFVDDMSTLGIADAFPSVATALESAFVPWSGVVGEFFMGPREDAAAPGARNRKRKATLTGVLTEEDMPTDFGAVKVRCLSVSVHGHGFDRRSSTSLVSQAPPTSAALALSGTGLSGPGPRTSASSLQISAAAAAGGTCQWLTRPPVAFTPLDSSASSTAAVDGTGALLTSSDPGDTSHFATLRKSLSRRESRIRQEKEKERRRLPSFRDLAILPTQRVTRYVLLFQDLLKHTPRSSPSYATVQNAVDAAVRLAQKCDRAQGNSAFLHPA